MLLPFLALLLTILAFAVAFFSGFLNSPSLVRLLQGPTASFYSLPFWLRYCLLHPLLLKVLGRAGCGFSVLGSMLTLFLLLKTEPLNVAFKHLAGIGWSVLLMTGLLFGVALGDILFPMIPALVKGKWISQLLNVFVQLLPAGPVLAAFFFVAVTIPFSFVQIARRRSSATARPMPHVLQ